MSSSSCISGSSIASRPAVSKMIDVAALLGGELDGLAADRHRVGARDREHRDAELGAEGLQLIDGGRAVDVGRDQAHLLAVGLVEVAGELAAAGGLARALEADHHEAGGALLGPLELGVDRAHHLGQLVLADLDEGLLGRDALDAVLLGAWP
jgi:hypothetical protein